jgi:LCP family protein required for cell wall assembly
MIGHGRPGSGPGPRLRFTRRARYIGRALFGAAAALVLVGAGAGWYLHTSVLGGLATSNALAGLSRGDTPDSDLNILLMGLDSRRDNEGSELPAATLAELHAGSSSDVGGYNANTLILLHVPSDGSRAIALSIPRDDYVDLPDGLGKHKIKEAYGRAKAAAESAATASGTTDRTELEQLGREAGRKASIEAVQDLLGVTVDHFAEVNLVGFYDLANALGGVQVCLKHPVNDWYSGASFAAGVQTLDGSQALAFVRQRHGLPNGDLDRTHRQQAFLASAVHQLRSEGVLDDLSRVGALLHVARKDVVVDSGFDLLGFAQQAGAVTSGDVTFYTLPIQGYATVDGVSVNVIDPAKVQQVAQQLLSGNSSAVVDGASATATAGPEIPQVAQDDVVREMVLGHATTSHVTTKHGGKHAAAPTTTPTAAPTDAAPAPAAQSEPSISAPPGVPCVD